MGIDLLYWYRFSYYLWLFYCSYEKGLHRSVVLFSFPQPHMLLDLNWTMFTDMLTDVLRADNGKEKITQLQKRHEDAQRRRVGRDGGKEALTGSLADQG